MIFTLVIGLTLALFLGMLAQKLKLSPLVGYLVAGMVAACPVWGEEVDAHIVEDFSHIGVLLLLFGVGLQFHFKDLLAVRKVVVPGALVTMPAVALLGMLVFHYLGMGETAWYNSLMYGLCICISSTVVLTRVLSDNRVLQTPAGHTALGWLVMEDLFTIVLLVLLPALFSGKALAPALGMMALKLVLLILFVLFLARKLIRKILTSLARSTSGELFTLAVLVCALGIAVISTYVFDASMEFGAFISGMVVGQSRFASRAASDALPMRDAFAVLFFVSVGMGFRPLGLVEYWPLAIGTLGVCMLGKPLVALLMVLLTRRPLRLGILVGGSLSQIGEFSFILATMIAGQYKLLPTEAANVITGVAILSITLNAALYRFVPMLADILEQRGYGQNAPLHNVPEAEESRDRVLLVGHGPCGQLVARVLRRYDVDVVIIEMNIDTVNRLMNKGIPAIHGDATKRTILHLAGCEKARAIAITSAGAPAAEIAAAALSLNPAIRISAHTHYIRHAQSMIEAGASSVFSGEAEVALAMSSHMLRIFGATEEQIMRERQENRKELFDRAAAEAAHAKTSKK